MKETNRIYNIDALEGLKQISDNTISVIITSPPYNKTGLNGIMNRGHRKWDVNILYGGNNTIDNMNEDEYQAWQIQFLNECYRVLEDDGSMFYNHKNRIYTGTGEIISPYEWLYKTSFKIRQELIWDRGSTNNVRRCRYLPTTEKIFWLTKSNKVNFDREKDTKFKGEVWSFPFGKNTEHPAPFPIELPDNILHCIPIKKNENNIVLDPFMGSGTVAVSALKNGFDYIGFEILPEYVRMAENNIEKYKQHGQRND